MRKLKKMKIKNIIKFEKKKLKIEKSKEWKNPD
jgi:hypothetical protein